MLLLSCSAEYSHLRVANPDEGCLSQIAPVHIESAWYNASVNVMGRHISGLLLIKNMPDSTHRIVFTNEAGVTFFDFGFSGGDFQVHTVISQLDKKSVINTLQKDFELILGLPFQRGVYKRFFSEEEVYFGVARKKETAYFITSKDCAYLRRLEWGSARKRKVTVRVPGSGYPSPDKIELEHHTFDMQINLTRIPK